MKIPHLRTALLEELLFLEDKPSFRQLLLSFRSKFHVSDVFFTILLAALFFFLLNTVSLANLYLFAFANLHSRLSPRNQFTGFEFFVLLDLLISLTDVVIDPFPEEEHSVFRKSINLIYPFSSLMSREKHLRN